MYGLLDTLADELSDREYAHAYLEESGNMRIAAQVRALRMQRGWSQQQLAERASMKQERISKIEMADFESLTLKTLRRLAEAFDVHVGVKFTSVAEALTDFVSLSREKLECDSREVSLRTLAQHKPFQPSIVATSIPIAINTSATTASTISIEFA